MRQAPALWFICTIGLMVIVSQFAIGQGVTTSAITGIVVDNAGNPLVGANVIATHVPSGSTYGASTREDGRFTIAGMRVGGPYSVTVSFIGYEKQTRDEIYLTLGVATDLRFVMRETGVTLEAVEVTAQRDPIFSSQRTGAATSVSREVLESLPTISRRIEDFTRLTPQASGFSFAGQDNRLNNITVDGSYFNNSFGLAGQPGDRTGVAPISLDAIEQVQVNIAPYDVRQGHFIGAGVNTVTKSGTNKFSGSAYYQWRTESAVGARAGDAFVDFGQFNFKNRGVRLSGPIIPNTLFFFTSFEKDELSQPGTTYRANLGGETVGGNVTRVLASDLNRLQTFLRDTLAYDPGPYQGYNHLTPATRFLVRFDYNLDEHNKISLRYNQLDSETDVLVSNSSSLGFGNRRSNTTGLNFKRSNYTILENIRSVVAEWNSVISENMTNNLIVGYSHHDESRGKIDQLFPFVDILSAGTVYTSFGSEPFTPNNELRYWTYQLQNNFTYYLKEHTLTFGISAERYQSENVFFPGSQSVYVYNSLADFYTDAYGYLANPTRTVSPVTLRRFQVRWMNIPGLEKPIQPLKVFYAGAYAQDEWQVMDNLKLTLGLRVDVPFFGDTGYRNANADSLTFMDEKGKPVQYQTKKLPDPHLSFSPRFGFNWDVFGDRSTQVRGGTGLFSGPPLYVWISNQIGNTGVLTGFERLDNTTARPFHPDPKKYWQAPSLYPDGSPKPAARYELALTDPDFRFPQLWRSNIAVDQKLPLGLVGTLEFMYNKDVNGIYYINANLQKPNSAFVGPDNRPRWTNTADSTVRINRHVDNAIVLKNQNVGYSWNFAASLELPYTRGFYAKAAYSYGEAKNTVDPGSIAFGSWNNNPHPGDPNNPGLGFSFASPGHRIFATVTYRTEGGTTFSVFWESRTQGNTSYTFGGDMNNDGGTSNDLIYIPRDTSEMNFQQYTSGSVTFTRQQQQLAWESYINQDPYLSKNRGKYAERGAVFLPMVSRVDLSITQDVSLQTFGIQNSLQFRIDILNFGNLLRKDWGVGDRLVTTQPLIPVGVDANGKALYRLRAVNNQLISKTFEKTANVSDVYRVQFGVRYTFN